MAVYVSTDGFNGGFCVRPKRIKEWGPDKTPVYTVPIRISPKRLGIDKSTKLPVGMFDTDWLPMRTVQACKEVYGEEGWQQKLEAEIKGLNLGWRILKKGETLDLDKEQKRLVTGTRTVGTVRRGGSGKPMATEAK